MECIRQQNGRAIALAVCIVVVLGGGCAPEGPETINDFFSAIVDGDTPQVKAGLHHHHDWARAADAEDYNRTALHKACGWGHKDVAELLLSEGAHLDARDQLGYTPLMYSMHGRNDEIAVWLIDRGARVNLKDKNDFTPLHKAAFAGMPDVVKALIRNKAALDAKAGRETPLHLAAQEGHVKVARILLENGADVNGGSDGFWTPMSLASNGGHKDIVELLKEYGGEQ